MKLTLVAAGTRMPGWVTAGFDEYARRLPRHCRLELCEIRLGGRGKSSDPRTAVIEEGRRMLGAIPSGAAIVALEIGGSAWSTPQLAGRLEDWLADGRDRAFLIGGPDGLDPACVERADLNWSLSPLTLPHGLVRVLVAEQLYRAWSILEGHPYHR